MYVHGYTSPFPCFETDRTFVFMDTKGVQAKYRALRAFGWKRYAFQIKCRVWMRLDLVMPGGQERFCPGGTSRTSTGGTTTTVGASST